MEILISLIGVVMASCIIPVVQFIKIRKHSSKITEYSFSEQLFDLDLDELSFEDANNEFSSIDRRLLADRGWVRCPVGTVMSNEQFEKRKMSEYEKELP